MEKSNLKSVSTKNKQSPVGYQWCHYLPTGSNQWIGQGLHLACSTSLESIFEAALEKSTPENTEKKEKVVTIDTPNTLFVIQF